jgi:hypothetical protein
LLGLLAVSLAFLRAVDAAEADTFSVVVVVQDLEGLAVEDGDDVCRSANRESIVGG